MNIKDLAKLIDISAVRSDSDLSEVKQMCEAAKIYHTIGVFSMPWCVPHVVNYLKDAPEIRICSVTGFPSGGESTAVKLATVEELLKYDVTEIDAVMNIGALKSACYSYIEKELNSLRKATNGLIMKVIIEAPLLNEGEVITATRLVADSGADYVKSGTGWYGATSTNCMQLMCEVASGRCKVKADGGIRTLDTILSLYSTGVTRFGVGVRALDEIMQDAVSRENVL